MSLTLNMVGGGGGGLKATDALLRVQSEAGSVVTITKGGVTKTDAGHENAGDPSFYDYYFIIHQSQFDSVNPWTVTATHGTKSETATIIIDTADEYNLSLIYALYLYKDGVFETEVTGGLAVQYCNGSGGTTYSYSNNADDTLTMNAIYNSGNEVGNYYFRTANKVDVTNYSKMVIDINSCSFSGNTSDRAQIGVGNLSGGNLSYTAGQWAAVTFTYPLSTPTTLEIDIHNLTGLYYFGVCLQGTAGVHVGTMNISRIGLTR